MNSIELGISFMHPKVWVLRLKILSLFNMNNRTLRSKFRRLASLKILEKLRNCKLVLDDYFWSLKMMLNKVKRPLKIHIIEPNLLNKSTVERNTSLLVHFHFYHILAHAYTRAERWGLLGKFF